MISNLPNILTASRIGAIPVIALLLFLPEPLGPWLAALAFVLAALTDFFDGYIARRRQQQSSLGVLLDPIADKLLVAAVLFMLVAFHHVTGATIVPAAIILCREILVSGLREFLAGLRIDLPVSRLAKWKTGIQMIAIIVLLLAGTTPSVLAAIGAIGLWIAAALTVITGYDYFRQGLRQIAAREATQSLSNRARPSGAS
ncbi:MAG: CDP-diacylglycerol--glycerol-3-phosphate 3-phosphatidyltransferase [Alphaproteobacteria bacterium]